MGTETRPSDSCASTATSSKTCRVCQEEKPLTGFHRDGKSKDGRASRCGTCASSASRTWYGERKADPEFTAARSERGKDADKRWREANPDYCRQRNADYRASNRPTIRDTEAQWRAANPDRVRAKHQRRRASLMEAFVEDVDPAEIWARDGGTCQLCDEPIDPGLSWPHRMSKTLDHIVPLARGGTHEASNVQLAHATCNSSKGANTL